MIIGLGLLSALLLIALIVRALKTRPRHTVSGDAGLVGSVTVTSLRQTPTTAGCICRVNTGKCTAPHPAHRAESSRGVAQGINAESRRD
jgi:hypothetical protein